MQFQYNLRKHSIKIVFALKRYISRVNNIKILQNYNTDLNLSPRPSSVKDANELKELFEKELKFSIVKIFQDLTKDEVLNWLKQSKSQDLNLCYIEIKV